MGHPLGFTQEAPVFYPPTIPLLLTGAPVHRLADVFSLAHLWLAGLGAFLLVRFLAGARVAPFFAGLAYMLSARTLQSVTWPGATAVAALLPFVLLGIALIARERYRIGLFVTAVSGGLALLAARPQSLLGAAPVFVAFTAAQLLCSRDRRRFLVELALASALAALLGAPAVLPSVLVLPETERLSGLTAEARNVGSLTTRDVDQVFLPVDGLARWPEAASYPGAATALLFLAGIALVVVRSADGFSRTTFLALAAAGLVGFAFAFGDAGPYHLVSSWPLLRGFRAPVRFLSCFGLALAVGSGLALAAFETALHRGRALALVSLAVLTADLGAHAAKSAATVPDGTYRVRPPLAIHLAGIPADPVGFPRRFWSFGLQAPVHLLPDADRIAVMRNDELPNAAGGRFGLESVQGAGVPLARTQEAIATRSVRVAQLSGAARLIVPDAGGLPSDAEAPPIPPALVVRTPDPFSRAILVYRTIAVPKATALTTLLAPSFDPSRTAIVEEGVPWSSPGEALANLGAAGAVALADRQPARVTLETRAAYESFLVFFDAWSSGWSVSVDGVTERLFRSDVCFRGVRLAAGSHRVVFEYRAPGVRDGLLLGLLGALLLVALAGRRPRSGPMPGGAPFP